MSSSGTCVPVPPIKITCTQIKSLNQNRAQNHHFSTEKSRKHDFSLPRIFKATVYQSQDISLGITKFLFSLPISAPKVVDHKTAKRSSTTSVVFIVFVLTF